MPKETILIIGEANRIRNHAANAMYHLQREINGSEYNNMAATVGGFSFNIHIVSTPEGITEEMLEGKVKLFVDTYNSRINLNTFKMMSEVITKVSKLKEGAENNLSFICMT